MENIGEKFEKYLKDKIELRSSVNAEELYSLIIYMGLSNDYDTILEVLTYFSEKKIDIIFDNSNEENYKIYKEIQYKIDLVKKIFINNERAKKIMESLEGIKRIKIDMGKRTFVSEEEPKLIAKYDLKLIRLQHELNEWENKIPQNWIGKWARQVKINSLKKEISKVKKDTNV